ncbi:Aspartic proteinase-like protein [Actinidia chinensis var. chinensis]|uniref:Aspartic proteinase-like protein n=1 Tax=Actinidia chinensis var. chinensis TaxID=1590841 RepID=A0A2R6R5G9_ACTCC|nr:Aspartic proteinase-like protein [Actinidia chinensis var. chinensis]
MAPSRPPFATTVSILFVIAFNPADVVFSSSDVASTVVLRPPHGGRDRHTMFLPLFLSPPTSSPNSSAVVAGRNSRRHLHGSDPPHPNAHMRLYDDLLRNGYYTTRLWIGTPPQKFALIVDTGSTVTYVPCSTCEQCGRHQDPKFEPELSSSYQPVKCNMECTCDNDRVQCIYERQYAEMSSSSGVLGDDILSFGNESELAPQRAVFGCENVETGDLYSQHADGIMGLGRGDLSVVDQLVDRGIIGDSFSLCYGGMDVGGGAMVLGGISPPPGMVFTHSDPVRSPYYNIDLKEIHVGGRKLPLNPRVFDGKHGTVLDSGTTYAYLPEAAFLAFKDAIMKELIALKRIPGPDPNYNDICFSGAGSDVSQLSKTFPVVDMVFADGQKLSLSPENYLFRHSKVRGAYCLGVFHNGKDPTTLLGGIIVRNTLVMYDREHENIGFWKTNCSELWERLQIAGAPPPVPSTFDRTNSTADVSPTPTGSPQHDFPGQFQVGLVTFYMSLSVNFSELKPHITELAQFIAQELGVNTSQVHLLNFTAKGNDSLIRWAIRPAESAEYFTNATAMGIIARLAEHRVQLPDTFGSYQLVEWNIEPPPTETWWLQNYIVVVVAIIVTLILVLSSSGGWIIWRQSQQALGSYKPVDVDTAIPEQELQPLQTQVDVDTALSEQELQPLRTPVVSAL